MSTFEWLWDYLIQEETRRVAIIARNNEILNQSSIGKVREGGKKGGPKKGHK
jgi:hypothetical protein